MARRSYTTPEVDIPLRFWGGVNRLGNARLNDPAAPWATVNKYSREAGILSPRPGSKLIVDGTAITQDAGGSAVDAVVNAPLVTANLPSGGTLNVLAASVVSDINVEASAVSRGIYRRLPSGLTAPLPIAKFPQTPSNVVTVRLQRVAGLHRLYLDEGINRFWVGAWNTEVGDKLGYFDDAAGKIKLLDADGITSVGANFYFLPYRYRHANATDTTIYSALGTNQLNEPFFLKDGAPGVQAGSLAVAASDDWDQVSDDPGLDNLPDSAERMYRCRAMCIFNGVVVYAGYRMRTRTEGAISTRWDNYVAFADLGTPHRLAWNEGVVSNLRVGDTEAEACTACATTVFETDQIGAQNQLVVFTDRRLWVFNGTVPPQTDAPLGGNFSANPNDIVGCVAPRSVVQTPYGVVFLGTDGVFYLLPKGSRGNILPISRKIQPVFRRLTPEQQSNIAAFWDTDGFYKLIMPSSQATSANYKPSWQSDQSRVKNEVIPEVGWYADMRGLKLDEFDMGVKWDGPMEGQKHSCFAVAWGASDTSEAYAGSAVDGCLYEINRHELLSDPQPGHPTKIREFDCAVVTGSLDDGDIHVDKRASRLSLSVATNRKVNIQTKLIVSGPAINDEQGEQFDEIIKPQGPVLGNPLVTGGPPFTLGSSPLSPPDDTVQYTEQPGRILFGKSFRAEIRERAAFEVSADGDSRDNFRLNFVANSVTHTASIAAGIYDGAALAAAIQVAMRAQVGGTIITVTYLEPDGTSNSGKFTIVYTGAGNFQLLWGTGVNVATDCNVLIGFNAADKTGATSYTSDFRPMDSLRARVSFSDLKFTYMPSDRRT